MKSNLVKLGLGSVSMFFDILFMIQHYILYPDHSEPIVERISLERLFLMILREVIILVLPTEMCLLMQSKPLKVLRENPSRFIQSL